MADEIWKPVVGFEGLYSVSSLGRVKSEDRVVPRRRNGARPFPSKIIAQEEVKGYMRVCLCTDGKNFKRSVHVLVLETFVGPRPDGFDACHNNGLRTDNRPENLRWGTKAENQHDRIAHGTSNHGERASSAKLTWDKVRSIRREAGTHRQIAQKYGMSRCQISKIIANQSWVEAA